MAVEPRGEVAPAPGLALQAGLRHVAALAHARGARALAAEQTRRERAQLVGGECVVRRGLESLARRRVVARDHDVGASLVQILLREQVAAFAHELAAERVGRPLEAAACRDRASRSRPRVSAFFAFEIGWPVL